MSVCRLWCALNNDSWVSPQKGPENGSSCIPDSWVLKGCNGLKHAKEQSGGLGIPGKPLRGHAGQRGTAPRSNH